MKGERFNPWLYVTAGMAGFFIGLLVQRILPVLM